MGEYVPVKRGARRLYCDRCNHVVDLQISDDRENWPKHKCRATHKAEPFSGWCEIPPIPTRSFDDIPPSTPPRKPPDLSYMKGIG
jgi:hypothetical protein